MSMRRPVDPLFVTTTPIWYIGEHGGGTGFFLNYQSNTYLITNRHVVDPEDIDIDKVKIFLRNKSNVSETNPYEVSLDGGEGVDWFGHPDSSDIDVAVVPIDPRLSTLDDLEEQNISSGSLAFTLNHIIHENISIDNRVSIVGYPGDFVDTSTLFPVKRNAVIASPYGQLFDGNFFFVTDARMHPGTSGSPVVMEARGMLQTKGDIPEERRGKGTYLLGVHSATFYGNSHPNDQSDTDPDSRKFESKYDLNAAWYPEVITTILAEM